MPDKRHRNPANAAPTVQARDKLTFLLALVPWLADRDRVTVAEAAEHFGMQPEEIRIAVRLIAISGIPGQEGAYLPDNLFDIDWDAFEDEDEIALTNRVAIDDAPRFSAREAAALIAGLQYLAGLPENADRAVFSSLMGKLSRGASAPPDPVAVERGIGDGTLALIRAAVADGVQIELDYRSSRGDAERRRVDPLRVESIDDDWYLRGWCHLREAVRTFRLDRISNAVVTDVPIVHRADEVRLPDVLFEPSPDDLEIDIEVASAAMPLLFDYIPEGAIVTEAGDRYRTTLRVSHYHGLKRLVASMPGVVRVIGPEQARRAVAEWAAAGAAQYRSGA